MTKALSDIAAGATAVAFIADLIATVAGAGELVPAITAAGYAIYTAITGGTTSHYTDARDSSQFWSDITCSIRSAIASDGFVTSSNFTALLTALATTPYVHADVVSTVHDYVAAMGVDGVRQVQAVGAVAVVDCSGCGAWCYEWDNAGHQALNSNWSAYTPAGTPFASFSGGIWHSVNPSGTDQLYIQLTVDPTRTLTDFSFVNAEGGGYTQSDLVRFYSGAVGSSVLLDLSGNTWHGSLSGVTTILISMTPGHSTSLSQITIRGVGLTSPWGTSNCS